MCVPSGSVDQKGSVNGAAAPKLAAEMVCCCCALPSMTKLADRASSGSVICKATIYREWGPKKKDRIDWLKCYDVEFGSI